MPRFRSADPAAAPPPSLPAVIDELLAPAHFFAGPGLALECERAACEETSWEVFQGRLLDPAHTRQRRTFTVWNVHARTAAGRSGEPLVSLKLDTAAGQLHVVRGLEVFAWEGHAEGNVVHSRERRKWARELVGTIDLAHFADLGELRDELACLLFQAVVGTSRLPLHSVESPLPAFTFGQLHYCYRPGAGASDGVVRSWRDLIGLMTREPLSDPERVKLLEAALRSVPADEVAELADASLRFSRPPCAGGLGRGGGMSLPFHPNPPPHGGKKPESEPLACLAAVFNAVSLSPWTDFADKALAFVRALEARGRVAADQAVDFLAHLLRQTTRHLTAYDLVTFHFRGANYPDALLLDLVLKEYLGRIERRPELFTGDTAAARLRRRALRQAWLVRRQYEGHPVPDLPTSPGENARVLPESHPRVPEEQLLNWSRRTRRLYAGDPLPERPGGPVGDVLVRSVADLQHADELRELGVGLFIDRPFGAGKAPAEPDATPLLAATAFSRSVAVRRLRQLTTLGLLPAGSADALLPRLDAEAARGLPLGAVGGPDRPGAISLALARQAAADFAFRHTTRGGAAALWELFDLAPLAGRTDLGFLGGRVLVARSPSGPGVRVHDADWRPRLELEPPPGGFMRRAGVEYPAGGLLAVRAWDAGGAAARIDPPAPLPPR